MKWIIFLASLGLMTGCSLLGGAEPDSQKPLNPNPATVGSTLDPKLIEKFNEGVEALDNEEYKVAQGLFESLLQENPTSRFELVIQYNLAASYEGQGLCKKAGRRYRKVARSSLGKFKRLEAQSLYRLSFAYTCIGADEKAIVSLLDARRRKRHLQEEVAIAEIPARLASAYAQLGNRKKAKAFYSEARNGIQYLRSRYKEKQTLNDILAKTLFLMGRISPIENRVQMDSLEYLQGLEYLQAYLLEVIGCLPIELNRDLNIGRVQLIAQMTGTSLLGPELRRTQLKFPILLSNRTHFPWGAPPHSR